MSIKTGLQQINNSEHFKVDELFVDFHIGNADVQLDNLFNGHTELSEAMNGFLNENWKSIAMEMRPAIEDTISKVLQEMAGRFFDVYTLNQLLPD